MDTSAGPENQDPQTPGAPEAVVRIAGHIADVSEEDWDDCARGESTSKSPPNPFVSHAFLRSLEESGSAARETGWLPQHLLVEDLMSDWEQQRWGSKARHTVFQLIYQQSGLKL